MEFHISRHARNRYAFDEALFTLTGNVLFADFRAARVFAQKMNEKRNLVKFPEQAVKPGEIYAMGLIDEILHYVVTLYRQDKNPNVLQEAIARLYEKLGKETVEKSLFKFSVEFPPVAVYRHEVNLDDTISNRLIVLEEIFMLWLANTNPAFSPYLELFDDTVLKKETAYLEMLTHLHDFMDTQPGFGPDNQNLIDMLRTPAVVIPDSIFGQLEYIREKWGCLLGKFLQRLLIALDVLREEHKLTFMGPGPSHVYDYTGLELEPEGYSRDIDWMPKVVLIAKNTYVWLDQLSKKYQRQITRLDEIPDEELDTLARWGFTVLWLIGLWERSPASQKIKQLCGNPEAVPSAYSLFDYQIATDLGGEGAYQNLKERAWKRGIRTASDMVPNHVGIYSRWVIEHPDWFIHAEHPPYPSYTFNGPNLSLDVRIGVYIEDHYYSRTDAAVVFKRLDHWTGSEQYIYHGNDGTSMPWNDTAQLNFLKPEVREAVIRTILHVARKFNVIRFDAAMTLTKKHYQRLWFPEPGTGGAIPSRAEHGMTKEQFNNSMLAEFWREVVDRVAKEAPDTLLLAEAFWLLEGYFVRTLGMHRVYNSAFMNMLRDEDNAKYRSVTKNTLGFDPEVLKRFVNFMNNPDERTAIDQFGKDDKYFGICTMMATMPGLPMFGHGQIEGYTEKYGMEYRRAYRNEEPDRDLVQRHEREIFPLLRRRHLFAHVQNFLVYDFFTPEGYVNEDVFAYSNRFGDERALIIYHNKYAAVRGWIRTSVAYSVKTGQGEGRALVQKTLGEGLALHPDENYFCIFRDHVTRMEYIRNSKELCEKGLFVELGAYKCRVFIDFREVRDTENHQYARLSTELDGRGISSIDEALRELLLRPIHAPFKELVNTGIFRRLIDMRVSGYDVRIDKEFMDEVESKITHLAQAVKEFTHGSGDTGAIANEIYRELKALLQIPVLETLFPLPESRRYKSAIKYLKTVIPDNPFIWGSMLAWVILHPLGKLVHDTGFDERSRSWIDEWMLSKIIKDAICGLGLDESAGVQSIIVIKFLITHQNWFDAKSRERQFSYHLLESMFKDSEVRQYLQVNLYNDILWFNKEAFEYLLCFLFLTGVVKITASPLHPSTKTAERISELYKIIQQLHKAEEKSEYQVEKLLKGLILSQS